VAQAQVPLALILVAIIPLVLTVSVGLVLDPLANIAVSAHAFPHTVAVFDTIDPFTVIGITVCPGVETLSTDTSL